MRGFAERPKPFSKKRLNSKANSKPINKPLEMPGALRMKTPGSNNRLASYEVSLLSNNVSLQRLVRRLRDFRDKEPVIRQKFWSLSMSLNYTKWLSKNVRAS